MTPAIVLDEVDRIVLTEALESDTREPEIDETLEER